MQSSRVTTGTHRIDRAGPALVIRGTGSYLPEHVLTNDDIERRARDFDRRRAGASLDDWVYRRIGVRSRHWAAPGQGSADLAVAASRAALEDSGMEGTELDLIVMGTLTADRVLPPTVSFVQRSLGAGAKCIQLNSACSGFLDALAVATGMMEAFGYRRALVVHSDILSAILDEERFLMQSIFGDGAGAVVLEASEEPGLGITAIETYTDGMHCEWTQAGGGARSPLTPESVADGTYYLDVDTKAIFPFAVERMAQSLRSVVGTAGWSLDEVDWVVAHQTGINITKGVADAVGIDTDRFLMTLDHTGNTGGATIPIALDHFNRLGRFAEGDLLVLPAVGAGMSWGAASCVWAETTAGLAARGTELVGAATSGVPR